MVGYTRVARFGQMDELTELWVAPSHSGLGVGRALLERCWPRVADARAGAGRARHRPARRPDPLHPVRRDARQRPLAHAPPQRGVPRAPLAGDRRRAAAGARAHARARRGRVEAPRAARDRPRAPAAARVLRPHAHLPGHDRRRARRGDGRSAGSAPTATSAPRSARRRRTSCRSCSPRSTGWRSRMEPESFGVFCTTDSWWLLDRLRRLGFRVHWPGWVMSSVPLPGLDRYLADRARARLL